MLKKITASLLLLSALLMLGGCVHQPYSVSKSNIAEGYKPDSSGVYIVSRIGETQPEFNKLLETSLVNKFEAAGLKAQYVTSNGLELDPEIHEIRARTAGANLILVVAPNGGTVMGYTNLYMSGKYQISGLDLKLNKVVYKSQMAFFPYNDTLVEGIRWNAISAQKLADDIFNEGSLKGLF